MQYTGDIETYIMVLPNVTAINLILKTEILKEKHSSNLW